MYKKGRYSYISICVYSGYQLSSPLLKALLSLTFYRFHTPKVGENLCTTHHEAWSRQTCYHRICRWGVSIFRGPALQTQTRGFLRVWAEPGGCCPCDLLYRAANPPPPAGPCSWLLRWLYGLSRPGERTPRFRWCISAHLRCSRSPEAAQTRPLHPLNLFH